MKTAKPTPANEQAKVALVRWVDAHKAVAAENPEISENGEGVIQAYEIDGVLVVTAEGDMADRLQMLLDAAEMASPVRVDPVTAEKIRGSA